MPDLDLITADVIEQHITTHDIHTDDVDVLSIVEHPSDPAVHFITLCTMHIHRTHVFVYMTRADDSDVHLIASPCANAAA